MVYRRHLGTQKRVAVHQALLDIRSPSTKQLQLALLANRPSNSDHPISNQMVADTIYIVADAIQFSQCTDPAASAGICDKAGKSEHEGTEQQSRQSKFPRFRRQVCKIAPSAEP